MKEKYIKVILKKPNEKAYVTEIKNEYEELSSYCEGLIDITGLPNIDGVDIIVNDMSLMNGMQANIVVPEYESVLAGPIVVTSYDDETGEAKSLTQEQIDKVMKYFDRNKVFNMTVDRAYLYSQVIGPFQQCEDELKEECECQIG